MKTFDTYDAVKRLGKVGIPEEQASEIIHAIMNSREYDLSKLATKEQLLHLEQEISIIQKDIEYITREMATKAELSDLRAELKQDIADFKAEFKNDITNVKSEIANVKNEIHQVKFDLLKWLIPLLIGIIIAVFLKK